MFMKLKVFLLKPNLQLETKAKEYRVLIKQFAMNTFFSLLAILNSALAFSVQSPRVSRQFTLSSTHHEMETFERAVECAERFGACDIDKMEQLANELDEFNGAYFEKADGRNPAMMQKEVSDRRDVAEVLRLQGELRLRMEYLDGANLFAQDVHDMEDAYPEHQ
jgi:hypothetical protein